LSHGQDECVDDVCCKSSSAGSSPSLNLRPVGALVTNCMVAEFAQPCQSSTPDDIVVYVSGVFDLFHVGHASVLEKARALGTFLLVGVHDDSASNELNGRHKPVTNLQTRILNISACKHVSDVFAHAPLVLTEDMINAFNISLVAYGTSEKHCAQTAERFSVPRAKGMLREITSDFPNLHSETIAQRVTEKKTYYLGKGRLRPET